jgi:hypothetical protein
MLRDEVWQQLANKTQILCDPCCQERAKTLEIEITLATLEPCPFNLIGWPNSHFNRFAASTNELFARTEWVGAALSMSFIEALQCRARVERLHRMDAFLLATIGSIIEAFYRLEAWPDKPMVWRNYYRDKLQVSSVQGDLLEHLFRDEQSDATTDEWMDRCDYIVNSLMHNPQKDDLDDEQEEGDEVQLQPA